MYKFLEHTAELGLEVEAANLEELLEDAAHAFAELVADVTGFLGTPRPLIKTVTYRDLELVEDGNGAWKGKVILDV